MADSGRLSPLSIAIACYAGVAHLYALFALLPALSESGLVPYLVVVLAVSGACAVAELLARNRFRYRVIVVLHVLALAAGQYLLFSRPIAEIAVAGSLLLAIGLYERYPTNAITAAGALLLLAAARIFALVPTRADLRSWTLVGVPLVEALIAALACSLTLLRERLIETQTHGNRLEQAIGKLTQANQEYQDYLIHVEAESTERERKRITRDIHDVVGYTLTNNIMLMEAAIDMARSNPIGVSKILNTARENAQEGLERIRESLYSFRRRKIFAPPTSTW
jgi:signal transduction histidine kinase